MKKLMTLLSAAAVAFGLQAADTGTSFEGMTAGDLDITSTTGELAVGTSGYWVTNGNEQVSLTVTAGTSVNRNARTTISQFAEEDQDFYLSIKSPFGNPVSRKVKNSAARQAIGESGFYFDSQVKFTAFDEDPMTTAITNDLNGAKIAVWAREVYSESDPDVVTGTNLYVRAGFLGSNPVSYNCGGLPNPAAWHRLTIKAIRNIYASGDEVPGFVVFIDNQPAGSQSSTKGIVASDLNDKYVGFNDAGALYPSMVQDGSEDATMLSSVSFDGQGDVDDIVFTETAPAFAKDVDNVHINWTPADIATLAIDGTDLTSDQIAAGSYPVAFVEENLFVEVSVTYVEGKVDGTWTTSGSATTVPGESFSFTGANGIGTIVAANAAASFNGTSYATLAAAVTEANTAETLLGADYTLKLFDLTGEIEGTTVAINNQNGVVITIDLNGQTIDAIEADSAVIIVDSSDEKTGTVEGYTPLASGSEIRAGTFNDEVVADGISVSDGRFKVPQGKTTEEYLEYLNGWSKPQGKEFVEGTGDDTGYLVLGNATVKYTIKFISGEGSATNEYEIAAGGEVVPPVPAVVVGKEFSAWDPAVVTPAAADATYTALYTNKIYTITFVNEIGADPASTNYTIASGTITLPTATTENMGVQFDGWTNATITAAITQFTPAVENVGDFTLYAAWSSAGSTGFDGGDGSTFTIDPGAVATVETATGHQMTDTVAGSDMTYAQAYALGLIDENTGDVAELDATIELKDGKVVVGLSSTPTTGYAITLKVYEKASLTDAWPVEPTATYTLDSAEAAAGFTPGSAAAGFYKAEVTIGNK